MIFELDHYTDRIHAQMRFLFQNSHQAVNRANITDFVVRSLGLPKERTPRQEGILNKVIHTGIEKMIQLGEIDLVRSHMSTEREWLWHDYIEGSGYQSLLSTDNHNRARNMKALKLVKNRALSRKQLSKLNESKS